MTTWLITGCSSGLGRAFAEAVIAHGHNAVVTARDVAKVKDLADDHPETVLAVALDVTEDEQVTDAVTAAEERFGGIDVLVNSAGYGYIAAVEEGDEGDIRELVETHVFGTIRTIKAVLPGMRSRGSGTVVNISSIGARISPVASGYYAAAKSAVEGLTIALRKELEPLGISAMVVEPGAFRTDFAGRSLKQSESTLDDYAATSGKRREGLNKVHGNQPGDPAKAAQALINVVASGNPPYLLLLGSDAVEAIRGSIESISTDINTWEAVSRSTDLDTGEI